MSVKMLVKTDQLGSVQVKDSIFFKILLNNDVLKLAEDYLHRGNVTFELRKGRYFARGVHY